MAEGRNEFPLPPLGGGVTEATIVRWAIEVGDRLVIDRPICSVDADGVALDLISPFAGTVTALGAEAGQALAVGEMLLAVSDDRPQNGPAVLAPMSLEPGADSEEPDHLRGGDAEQPKRGETGDDHTHNNDDEQDDEQDDERHVRGETSDDRAGNHDGGLQYSPLVRRLADEFGVELSGIEGTGPGGRITRDDVHRAAFPDEPLPGSPRPTSDTATRQEPADHLDTDTDATRQEPVGLLDTDTDATRPLPADHVDPATEPAGPTPAPDTATEPSPEPIPTIDDSEPSTAVGPTLDAGPEAGGQERAGRDRAPFSLTIEVDAGQLVRAQRRLAARSDGALGLDALLVKLVGAVAVDFDELRGEAEHPAIGFLRSDGSELVTEVVTDVGARSLNDVERAMSDRIRHHRPGDESIVAPVTVLDAGSLGVTATSPPLPPGGAAVVAIGAVRSEPSEALNDVATVTVAATFDSDVIDLVRAARFLDALRPYLEDPILAFAR